jgi:hypothetical protein
VLIAGGAYDLKIVTAGYSQTPQLKKLGLVPGARWAIHARPDGWSFESAPDPADEVSVGQPVDVLVAFVRVAAEIPELLERLEGAIHPAGALWIAWPRKAGGHPSDITDNVIRDAALKRSLVDTKVAAVDVDWSAVKLVWRLSARS